MFNKVLLAASAAFLLSAPALAADMPRPAPRMHYQDSGFSPFFSWTGFYVGAHAGGAWSQTIATIPGFGEIDRTRDKGWLVGGQVGYLYQLHNNLVVGVEGDFGTGQYTPWRGSARGVMGYAFGQWLPYVTAGWAWQERKWDTALGLVKQDRDGWTAGGGLRYALTRNVSVGAEYLYTDFGSASLIPGLNLRHDEHVGRVRLDYKF